MSAQAQPNWRVVEAVKRRQAKPVAPQGDWFAANDEAQDWFKANDQPEATVNEPLKSEGNVLFRGLVSPKTIRRGLFESRLITGAKEPATQEDIVAAREAEVAKGSDRTEFAGGGLNPINYVTALGSKAGALEFSRGVRESVSNLFSGATSPAGVAAMIPGPQQAPIITALGAVGAKEALTGRQEGEDTPAMLERRLSGAAMATGAAPFAPKAVGAVARGTAAAGRATGTAIRHPIRTAKAGIEKVATPIEQAVLRRMPPEQKLMQAAQPPKSMKNAPESFRTFGPEMQRVRQRTGAEIRGEEALPESLRLTRETKRDIWENEMVPRLRAAGKYDADTTAVADSIESSIHPRTLRKTPELAERIREDAAYYRGRRMTLDEIETEIQAINEELVPMYRSSDPRMTAMKQAAKAEVEALRRIEQQQLDTLTGPGVQSVKRRYGAGKDVERALEGQIIVRARQKGMPLYEALAMLGAAGDIVGAVSTFNAIGAVKATGRLAIGRALTRTRDPNVLLEDAFHGQNAFKPSGAVTQTVAPPRQPVGLLPSARIPIPPRGRRTLPPAPEIIQQFPPGSPVPPSPAARISGPAPDTSFVRGVPASPGEGGLKVGTRALPPPSQVQVGPPQSPDLVVRPARKVIERDPRTGRMKVVYRND